MVLTTKHIATTLAQAATTTNRKMTKPL